MVVSSAAPVCQDEEFSVELRVGVTVGVRFRKLQLIDQDQAARSVGDLAQERSWASEEGGQRVMCRGWNALLRSVCIVNGNASGDLDVRTRV